jgi:Cutinase
LYGLYSLVFTHFTSKMMLSFLLSVLSLGALALAHPTYNDLLQVAELKKETDEFVQNYDTRKLAELRSNLTSTTASPSAECDDVFLIFSRGTFEPAMEANLGIVVGMPFSNALKAALGGPPKFGSIGVDYNNGVAGYLSGGDSAGGKTMAKMISEKALQCPRVKIIASGYR